MQNEQSILWLIFWCKNKGHMTYHSQWHTVHAYKARENRERERGEVIEVRDWIEVMKFQ